MAALHEQIQTGQDRSPASSATTAASGIRPPTAESLGQRILAKRFGVHPSNPVTTLGNDGQTLSTRPSFLRRRLTRRSLLNETTATAAVVGAVITGAVVIWAHESGDAASAQGAGGIEGYNNRTAYDMIQRFSHDAFGTAGKFGPVMRDADGSIQFPDQETITRSRLSSDYNPPQPTWMINLGVRDPEAPPTTVPGRITAFFDSQVQTQQTIRNVVITSDLSPIFGTPTSLQEAERILRIILADQDQFTIKHGNIGNAKEGMPAVIATREVNGKVVTQARVEIDGSFRWDHTYNV